MPTLISVRSQNLKIGEVVTLELNGSKQFFILNKDNESWLEIEVTHGG